MKRKNILLCIAIAVCLIACLFVFLVKVVGLNMIKHNDLQIGNLSVKYYGDFDSVKSVKIYDGAIRRGTFALQIDKNIIDKSNENPPYFDDLNGDGHEDILIPHSTDSNLSIRYAAFIWNNDIKMFEACEPLEDIANINFDNTEVLHSKMELRIVIAPEDKNVPEVYEKHYVNTQYKISENTFIPLHEDTLIYYSENDIYCNVIKNYDPENGELIFENEDWMTPEEAEKYFQKK